MSQQRGHAYPEVRSPVETQYSRLKSMAQRQRHDDSRAGTGRHGKVRVDGRMDAGNEIRVRDTERNGARPQNFSRCYIA